VTSRSRWLIREKGHVAICLGLLCLPAPGSASPIPAPRPTPAVPAIVSAFNTHPVVAIAESHGLRQAGDFYISLVRDAAFDDAVNDIVIEFASAQSQPLLDRYVLEGAALPADTLRTIWRNTTKVAAWEYPIYARWLESIRDVNRTRPAGKRLRVLAGDTRVDWPRMRSRADWEALGPNNETFARVIHDQVIARGHKALVVLGSNHLTRGGDRTGGPNVTTRIDALSPGALYVIWLYTGRPGGDEVDTRILDENWPAPALISLSGSWPGELAAGARRLRDVADALLYLAPSTALEVEQAPPESFDETYANELDRRSRIEWGDSTRARKFLGLPARGDATSSTAALREGDVQEFHIASKLAERARRVWVYTPPGYSSGRDTMGLVMAFDGGEYLTQIPLPHILDSLLAVGAMLPQIAVMIDDSSSTARLDDLANRAWFVDFLGKELVPWVRARWRVTRDPHRVIVTGSSAGGLAAAHVALRRPDLFGNVFSQSGAFWRGAEASNDPPYQWLIQQAALWPRRDVNFSLEVGAVENVGAVNGRAPSILASNRAFRDTLRAKGYSVSYVEVENGRHAAESWAQRLPAGLAAIAGRR